MLGAAFLSLMGAVFLAGLADMFKNDGDEQPDQTTQPDDTPLVGEAQPGTGTDLLYTGEAALTGTEFADTLTADNPGHTADSATLVNLLGGDDVAEVATALGSILDGGDGDDELTSTAVSNTLVGGAGDDVLSGINANTLTGGEGDDIIDLDLTVDFNDTAATATGGAGDDEFTITGRAGFEDTGLQQATFNGGEGDDTYAVTLQLGEQVVPDTDGDPTVIDSGTDITIADFDRGADALQVTIERTDGSEDRDVTATTLTSEVVGGEIVNSLVISFEANAAASAATSTIRIISDEALTLADIVIVANNPVAAAA